MDQDERLRFEPSNVTGQWRLHRSTPGNEYIGLIEDRPLARRIVACVNACRGIPTHLLERLPEETLRHILNDAIWLAEAMRDRDDD